MSVRAIRHPATGALVAEVADADRATVEAAAASARRMQVGWVSTPIASRARVLDRFRRRLLAHRRDVIATIQSETGKPYEEAQVEVGFVALAAQHWAKTAPTVLAERTAATNATFAPGRSVRIQREPHGLVGAIGPWNFPFFLTIGDILPALLAGNGILLKPSELTPLSAQIGAQLLTEAGVPEGLIQVLPGAATTGEAVVDHADYVTFTGSSRTGRAVASRAAGRLIGCTLELGGNDPMLVLGDADVERAATAAVSAGLLNAGQACLSVERIYVDRGRHDELVEAITRKVKGLRLAPGTDPGASDIGPMIRPEQVGLVAEHLKDAMDQGARAVTGGLEELRANAPLIPPTVLVGATNTMRVMREETFGPVLPIMATASDHEAITLANDSDHGLAASVWTRDLRRGRRVAAQLQAGTVSVNDAFTHASILEAPMAGWKASGLGGRHGEAGLTKFCRERVVVVNRSPLRREPWWMPYDTSPGRLIGVGLRGLLGTRLR